MEHVSITKELGKIVFARFGTEPDRGLFGLEIEFKIGSGGGVCGWWSVRDGAADIMESTLKAAKKNWLHQLVGTPVEISLASGNRFHGFRVLEEVL